MTKRENFEAIKGILREMGHDEFDAFIDHEVELLSRKRTAPSKPSKRQIENEALKGAILDVLARADEGGMTIGEIAKVIDFEGATPNRVNALVSQLKKAGTVLRKEVKGKAMFTIA